MFNTFNMGIGMTVVVAKEEADQAMVASRPPGRPPCAWVRCARGRGA